MGHFDVLSAAIGSLLAIAACVLSTQPFVCFFLYSGAIGLTDSIFSSELPNVRSGFYDFNCIGDEMNLGSCLFQLTESTASQCDTASVVCQGKVKFRGTKFNW